MRDVPTGRRTLIVAASVMLVIAAGYFLTVFATGALAVVNPGRVGQLDLHIATFFFDLRSAGLTRFFTMVTAFGSWPIIFTVAASATVLLALTRRPRYIAGLWLALIGNQTLVTLIKGLFLRPRPEYGVYHETSASFPSGHSAASVALFGFLTYVLLRERVGPKGLALAGGIATILLVGSSRLVLGEHYFSDVVSGYLVGAVWVVLGICVTELWFDNSAVARVTRPWPRIAVGMVALGTVIALWFIAAAYVGSLIAESGPG